jgi:hypothetical protein
MIKQKKKELIMASLMGVIGLCAVVIVVSLQWNDIERRTSGLDDMQLSESNTGGYTLEHIPDRPLHK